MIGVLDRIVAKALDWVWPAERGFTNNGMEMTPSHNVNHTLERHRDKKGRFVKIHRVTHKTKCNVCLADYPTIFTTCSCGHAFCKGCMKTMFLNALKDHSLIPVRCCGPVDQSLHAALLSRADAARYKEALEDSEAKEKMVCPNHECQRMINLDRALRTRSQNTPCPQCGVSICLSCRAAHPHMTCAKFRTLPAGENGTADVAFYDYAAKRRYPRCPTCRSYVERVFGCNRIMCRCQTSFCYQCGARWKTCFCSYG